jgi:hypothetical protein
MGIFRGPNIVTDGLVIALDTLSKRSYPGSGNIWYDLSGNNINGTLQNSSMVTSSPGKIRLNQSTDRIQYGHNTLLEPVSITVAAWINLDDIGDRHILITKWYGFSFEIGADGRPYFRLNGPGDQYSSEAIEWGKWYYIVGTFNDSTKKHDCYINGVNRGTSTKSSSISYSQGSFNIPYTGNAGYAKGEIGPLYIYDRDITQEEVLQNYNAQKERFM